MPWQWILTLTLLLLVHGILVRFGVEGAIEAVLNSGAARASRRQFDDLCSDAVRVSAAAQDIRKEIQTCLEGDKSRAHFVLTIQNVDRESEFCGQYSLSSTPPEEGGSFMYRFTPNHPMKKCRVFVSTVECPHVYIGRVILAGRIISDGPACGCNVGEVDRGQQVEIIVANVDKIARAAQWSV